MSRAAFAGFVLAAAALALAAIAARLDGGYAIEATRGLRREFADWRLAVTRPSVPCPTSALVIMALGQSNAANHVGPRVGRDDAVPAYAFFRSRCMRIEDPIPGATGADGSLWIQLAQRLVRERGQPVVIMAAGAGGSTVDDWDEDRAAVFSRAISALRAAGREGLTPPDHDMAAGRDRSGDRHGWSGI